jgi:iron complex outermembrane receptor protein
MIRKLLFILFLAMTSPFVVFAQDFSDLNSTYAQAEQEYSLGRFEQAIGLLTKNVNWGYYRQRVNRLASLCYLALDNVAEAERYAKALLDDNPSYNNLQGQDPIRFEEMIDRLRGRRGMTITTASSKEERLAEAPVPVTIITKDMIDMLGYNKNLAQILAVFVPGITEVASNNQDNIAMHGAYTTNQEKILIMENGHRLNARSTNAGRIDYAINTSKIDHIEVLRGPASSLYGNVALTAVVNIITKDGNSAPGLSVRYGNARNQTHKADLMAGAHSLNADVLVWGSFYSSNGEDRFIPAGTGFSTSPDFLSVPPILQEGYAHIGKYNEKPSFDIGFNLNYKDFSLMFSRKSGKKTSQYSIYGHTFDYDAYRWFDGQKPGYGLDESHAELEYKKNWGALSLSAAVYGDWYSFNDYAVASDAMSNVLLDDSGMPVKDESGNYIFTTWEGAYQVYDWKEMTVGSMLRADYNYNLGDMKGDVLVGAQFEHFSLYDTYGILGIGFNNVYTTVSEPENTILTGRENSLSLFLQGKHFFSSRFIMNAGFRYDRKYRSNKSRINALSPRIAFVYMLNQNHSMKLSFARSFVDAPYFYRANTDNSYKGGEDLNPEYMNSVQLAILSDIPSCHLACDVNMFYNKFTDMIHVISNAQLEDVKYRNSGNLETIGAEAVLRYDNNKNLSAVLSGCYNYPVSSADYYYDDHNIFSVPKLTANLSARYKPLSFLSLKGLLRYRSKFYVPAMVSETTYEVPSDLLVDLGVGCQLGRHLQLNVDCENVFDKTTYVSGATMTIMPWYRPGRVVMTSVKINLF